MEVDFERNPELRGSLHRAGPGTHSGAAQAADREEAAAGTHLLFLDEIQAAPEALAALRYFHEEMPELHVLAAGSLLEFALAADSLPDARGPRRVHAPRTDAL